MSHKVTRLEHPLWPAVVLHWVHLLSFFALLGTGLAGSTCARQLVREHRLRSVRRTSSRCSCSSWTAVAILGLLGFLRRGFRSDPEELTRRSRLAFLRAQRRGLDKRIPSWVAYYLFIRKTQPGSSSTARCRS